MIDYQQANISSVRDGELKRGVSAVGSYNVISRLPQDVFDNRKNDRFVIDYKYFQGAKNGPLPVSRIDSCANLVARVARKNFLLWAATATENCTRAPGMYSHYSMEHPTGIVLTLY